MHKPILRISHFLKSGITKSNLYFVRLRRVSGYMESSGEFSCRLLAHYVCFLKVYAIGWLRVRRDAFLVAIDEHNKHHRIVRFSSSLVICFGEYVENEHYLMDTSSCVFRTSNVICCGLENGAHPYYHYPPCCFGWIPLYWCPHYLPCSMYVGFLVVLSTQKDGQRCMAL